MQYASLLVGFQGIVGVFLFVFSQVNTYKYTIRFDTQSKIDIEATNILHNMLSFNIIATGFILEIFSSFFVLGGNMLENIIILALIDTVLGITVFMTVIKKEIPVAALTIKKKDGIFMLLVAAIVVYGVLIAIRLSSRSFNLTSIPVLIVSGYLYASSLVIYFFFVKYVRKQIMRKS